LDQVVQTCSFIFHVYPERAMLVVGMTVNREIQLELFWDVALPTFEIHVTDA
jgi:hypothetical protein